MKKLRVSVLSLLLFVALLFGAVPSKVAADPSTKQVGHDFALKDLNGKVVHFSDFRGKVVLLNFWATWCPPCRVEIPWFIDLQKRYGSQGLQILGISMDDGEDEQTVAAYATRMGINYPVLLGEGEVHNIEALPISMYCDREGHVFKLVPGLIDRREIEQTIKQALVGAAEGGQGPI